MRPGNRPATARRRAKFPATPSLRRHSPRTSGRRPYVGASCPNGRRPCVRRSRSTLSITAARRSTCGSRPREREVRHPDHGHEQPQGGAEESWYADRPARVDAARVHRHDVTSAGNAERTSAVLWEAVGRTGNTSGDRAAEPSSVNDERPPQHQAAASVRK